MITYNEVIILHEYSIKDFGGSNGIRDIGMLESAINRPNATYGSEELIHPHLPKLQLF